MLSAFLKVQAADYYWVGGSGNWNDINHWRTTSGGNSLPSVIPGATDNVFFDANSGFTSSSKTITINVTANCKNITFSGSAVAPTLTQSGSQTLNIYGSSVWQAGMGQINVNNIYYRHTGEAKTITSNGVITVSSSAGSVIYFEEENSISLLDDFSVGYNLYHNAGTFNTNSNNVTISYNYIANSGTKPRTINLGSSTITFKSSMSAFNTNSANVTLNSGTSHIIFTSLTNSTSSYGIVPYTNQVFNDVTFEKQGAIGGSHSGVVYYNNVVFLGDGNLYGDNNFKSLIFSPSKTYTLPSGKTQTIVNLFSANTPQCGGWSTIKSSTAGTQANISAAAGVTIDVSGIIIQDVNATGGANFTANNSVDNSNNTGWTFPAYIGQDLYWVGGSGNWNDKAHWSQTSGGTGGYCVPGPGDNVFFDAGSGFTSTNKTVTVDNISYAHNVTFAGSAVAPTLTQSGSQTLNIYGSSVWQSGMGQINVNNIYYRHTGEAKTITSNGVITGSNFSYVYFEEENSISLSDDFSVGYYLYHNAGIFNTNNFNVTISYGFYANIGTKPRTINLGSSTITFKSSMSAFNTNSANVTLNSGTSHIIFTSLTNSTSSYGIVPYTNQVFNDVTFEKQGAIGGSHSGIAYYNHVIFRGNGGLWNDNNIKSLFLNAGMTYTLGSTKTQTIDDLIIGGNPCNITYILSNTIGTQAKIQVLGSTVNFNFVSLKDINNIGQTIYFGEQSTNLGNNTNIIFEPYNPGGFDGLGADLMNYTIDTSNPSSYLISTSAFYGNTYTAYKWYKINSETPNTIISTSSNLDLRIFGYGNYKVEVIYSDGITENCTITDSIKISTKLSQPVLVNPNLRFRVNNP